MTSVAPGDGGGLFLSSNSSQELHGINVAGAVADTTQYGVSFELYDGTGFSDINIDMAIDSPIVANVNTNSLPFSNTVFINGGPVAPLVVGATGQPAFVNSWSSFVTPNGQTKFYKAGGRVYLAGGVGGGALASVIFTLPSGYRPIETERFSVATNRTTPANIVIEPSGTVTFEQGAADTGWLFMSCSFWVGP